jgi:hypothetical protein
MVDRAQIDAGMIARLRERSRPLRPEASLMQRLAAPNGERNANGQRKPTRGL